MTPPGKRFSQKKLRVLIVGIVEPNDKKDRFWHFSADGLLEPREFEAPPEIDPDYIELSQPVSIFVNKNAFAEIFESNMLFIM